MELRESGSRLVALAIPTFGRRLYLRRCLESIVQLTRPDSVAIHLLVLDNNPGADARGIFDEFLPRFDFPASYVHVKERGIPIVRNQAIEEALALNADLIAFLDDDEVAPAEWMVEAVQALDTYRGDVVSGPKARILPAGSPEWMKHSRRLGLRRGKREGPLRGRVSTCNAIFKIFLVREWGLRFRMDFNLTGGSDTVFFEEATRKGATVVWARKAVIYEWVPPSRAKLSWMLQRDFRVGVNDVRLVRIFDGELAAWRVTLASLGDVLLIRPMRMFVRELRRGPRSAFRGKFATDAVNYLGQIGKALGRMVSLCGYHYYEYRESSHGE